MINKIVEIAKADHFQAPLKKYVKPQQKPGINQWQRIRENNLLFERLKRAKPSVISFDSKDKSCSQSVCVQMNDRYTKAIAEQYQFKST